MLEAVMNTASVPKILGSLAVWKVISVLFTDDINSEVLQVMVIDYT